MRNRVAGFSAATALACTSLTACSGWTDESPGIIIGMSDEILSTDPSSGYDPGSWLLFNNVFQTLLSFPNGGTDPQPEAAESCAFEGAGVRVYRCVLKDDLKFSNGDPLTAEDVKFSFDRVRLIDDAAGPAVMFTMLDSVEAPDSKTVVFRLKVPDATFPSKIASGAGSIVNHRQYEAKSLREDGQASGSGPYKLTSMSKDEAVFSPNENYRGRAEVKNGGVTLKLFHSDQARLRQGLMDHDIDMAFRGLPAKDLVGADSLADEPGIQIVEGDSAEVQHLVFNMNDPVAGKIGFRKAMSHLLDRDALIKQVYQDTAIPLYSIIPAGVIGHTTAFFDTYGDRPSQEKAEAALRADGIEGKVELTLWSTPSRYGLATDQELRVIAEQLNSSGLFKAKVRSVPFDRYEKDIAAGKYGVYVKGWLPDYPDADNFTSPFFGDGNVLANNYSNRTISETLIPRSATEKNRAEASDDFGKIQDIVADDVPVLPIWQAKQYAAVHDDIRGYQYCLDASTVFRFWELSKV
ncbi:MULTISPECIES: ABC transporter substrate-binding protein [Streptomyces]|uniref:ABC transporter substrate-binding protein n=1 Tax=Streptomyces ortus TaxID=2867268 RepID=A0ABT3VAJ3_9ACTN|nr:MULTISPECIES: ABC transporter substrate-binding protein [Streptomyces]MCX4235680.1 ABC transporter substrate-binding protein [Streptomyces ortus]